MIGVSECDDDDDIKVHPNESYEGFSEFGERRFPARLLRAVAADELHHEGVVNRHLVMQRLFQILHHLNIITMCSDENEDVNECCQD